MVAEHLVITKVDDNTFIINNSITNRFIKLGYRECNYLLELLEKECIPDTLHYTPITEEQKVMLYKKYLEYGFLKPEKIKKKFELTNIKLFSFQFGKKEEKVFEFGCHLLPEVVVAFFISLIFFIIFIFKRTDLLLGGLENLSIGMGDLIALYVLYIVNIIIHEFGHMLFCYRYTNCIGRFGMKLYYLLPAWYSDVSNMYTINSRKKRAMVACAGIMNNCIFGSIMLALYAFLYKQNIICSPLLLFSAMNLTIIIINLNPFAKYDGYWIISALSGKDNLYDTCVNLMFMAVFQHEKFRCRKEKGIKKIAMLFYGISICVMHIAIWVYVWWFAKKIVSRYFTQQITVVVLCLFSLIIFVNCLKFFTKYWRCFKNERYIND